MGELFRTYKEMFDFLSSNSSMGEHMESKVTSPNNGDNDFLNDYYNVDTTSSYETETELDRYLREPKIELRKVRALTFSNRYLGNSNFNCGILKRHLVRDTVLRGQCIRPDRNSLVNDDC
ncbi:hypothetical protein Tco_1264415 [Tanacetum coccineum]